MKIFITGVAGFLGSHLADKLLKLGFEVCGVDNLIGGELSNVNPKVRFNIADCNNLNAMIEYSQGCDIVFHAACTAHDGLSVFSPYHITYNTFQATISVLSAALKNNVKKFIYCSSMSRYGEQETCPYTEMMICAPNVPYGIAKYAAEKVIERLSNLYGMQYTIIVPHNIIGPRQKYDDPYRNVAAIMINRVLQNKPPIIYGDGSQKRCFSYVDDVIYCLVKVISQDNVNGEIINVGPDSEYVTINEMTRMILDITQSSLEPIYLPGRPLEVKFANCSADKARTLLEFEAKVCLYDGLSKMVKYILKKGTKEFDYNVAPLEIINELTPVTWRNKIF
jgi:UDP-glucose 4-epimerase